MFTCRISCLQCLNVSHVSTWTSGERKCAVGVPAFKHPVKFQLRTYQNARHAGCNCEDPLRSRERDAISEESGLPTTPIMCPVLRRAIHLALARSKSPTRIAVHIRPCWQSMGRSRQPGACIICSAASDGGTQYVRCDASQACAARGPLSGTLVQGCLRTARAAHEIAS